MSGLLTVILSFLLLPFSRNSISPIFGLDLEVARPTKTSQSMTCIQVTSLPLFHAFTGCDTTSQLLGCGKKTAWAAWENMPEITETLLALMEDPNSFVLDSIHMQRFERFHVIMYSKSCSAATVNQARQKLFSHGLRSLEAIPPTQAALFEHLKRSILQACFIWSHADTCHHDAPRL